MKIGNIIACIGIVIGVIGFVCLPLWNLNEHPYIADPGYPKGGFWILLAQTGLFARPGLLLLIAGLGLFGFAKLLPKRYWALTDAQLKRESKKVKKKKNFNKKSNT